MKVYRLLSQEEFNLIKNGEKEKLGRIFYGDKLTNSHKYKEGVKYLHFYKHKEDIKYIKEIRFQENAKEDFYICEFDIPVIKLIGHKGKGKYRDLDYGFIERVTEYAIDARDFDVNWLKNYEKTTILSKSKKLLGSEESIYNGRNY